MAARLKVFVTGDGFTDYVVAVPSRAKALAAWGVSQDLFREGAARETDDPILIKAAMARPGQVLERTAGSRPALVSAARAPGPRAPAPPSKAALKRVAELEARMADLDVEFDERLNRIAAERKALDRREETLRAEQEAARAELSARLRRARAAVKPG